jgi:hypothetical protein
LLQALTKLDQLEVQLTTTKLSASSPQLIQLHSQVSKSIEEITSPPLQEGYSLLEIVGRGSPGIEVIMVTVRKFEICLPTASVTVCMYMNDVFDLLYITITHN